MFKRKKNINKLKLELKHKKITELLDVMLSADVDIHFAPISSEYFIVDEANQINICLSHSSVKIANHKYLYEVSFSLGSMEKYMNLAKNKVEEKATRIKKDLFKNEMELIDKIKSLYGE